MGDGCGGDFQAFISSLAGRPHVAENILGMLDAQDIINCLKTSTGLRQFIIEALQHSPQLQISVKGGVSRLAVTNGKLVAKQYGPMERGYWRQGTYYHRRIGFGIDDTLWICKPAPPDDYEEPDWLHNDDSNDSFLDSYEHHHNNGYTLCVYDLGSCKEVQKVDVKYCNYYSQLMVKLLLGHKVLMKDDKSTLLFSREGGRGPCKVIREDNMDDGDRIDIFLRPATKPYGGDCIYKIQKLDGEVELPWKLTFYGADGHLIHDSAIRLAKLPWQILQEVRKYNNTN